MGELDIDWPARVCPTTGEVLWTWRKRNRFSVAAAAENLLTSRLAYVKAEHDRSGPLPNHPTVVPTRSELLRILRRRSNVARDDVAIRLGVSHVTYLKLERQADERIVRLWLDEVQLNAQINEETAEI